MTPGAAHSLSPERLWQGLRLVLGFGLGLALLIILFLAWNAYLYLLAFPVLLLAGLGFRWLSRDALYLLCAVIGGFVFVAGYEAGIQVSEVLYGLVYLSYLAYWFISRLFFYRDRLFPYRADRALFGFLLFATASFGLTLLFQGDLKAMISEWLSLTMLAFYFPVKEACLRDARAPRMLLFTMIGIGLFIAARNFWAYWTGFSSATQLWQIMTGRVTENEHVLMILALGTLVLFLHSTGVLRRSALLLTFVVFTSGVIIGQSRALWVSMLLGMLVIFILIDRRRKGHLLLLGLSGLGLLVAVGFLFFDDLFTIIIAGLADRLSSLLTATSADISLINRFIEMGAAWEEIKVNPILGYGLGVPIRYYSLVYEVTYEPSFIHNGIIGLWYHHGLLGLGLFGVFFLGTIRRSLRLSRLPEAPRIFRIIGMTVAACFVAYALVGQTENPIATSDKTLMLALLSGLSSGLWMRLRQGAHTSPS